jgi:hypothetical protein
MSKLYTSAVYLQEASKLPGVLGRAGWSNVVSFRGHVAAYFQAMASSVDLTAPANHYGMIEPHVRAVMAANQGMLLSGYLAHARKALVLGAELEIGLQESDNGASANIARSSTKAEKSLLEMLDRLGLTGQQAVDYIIVHGAEMVKGIDAYSLKVIRSLIASGVEQQLGVEGTMRLIRSEFKDMKTIRARSIATTEMNDAMSEAALNKIRTVGLDGKRWLRSPGACPLCTTNALQGIIPVDATFQSGHQRPPGHPGKCRCAVVGARLSNQASFDVSRNTGKY